MDLCDRGEPPDVEARRRRRRDSVGGGGGEERSDRRVELGRHGEHPLAVGVVDARAAVEQTHGCRVAAERHVRERVDLPGKHAFTSVWACSFGWFNKFDLPAEH